MPKEPAVVVPRSLDSDVVPIGERGDAESPHAHSPVSPPFQQGVGGTVVAPQALGGTLVPDFDELSALLSPGQSATAPAGVPNAAPPVSLPSSGARSRRSDHRGHGDSGMASFSPTNQRTLAPGSMVGQYELIRELGRGGMGVVYLARDPRLGRRVALKLLQTVDPEWTRRFLIEARATAQFNHENIVVIHEVGVHEESPFMVLEYLQGQTLASLLGSGALQLKRAVEIMVSVLRALSSAQELGIVHRDLKPENIFLTDSGIVKVLDFGIAKVLRGDQGADVLDRSVGPESARFGGDANKSSFAGTLAYMSPEQWETRQDIDHRSDIWAVGVILFEMLAGRRPFAAVDFGLYHEVANLDAPAPSLADAAPELPRELCAAVDRCLRKRRDERYRSARELLQDLEPFLPGRFQPWRLFDRRPYTGLRAFQEDDAALFFGRSREIAAFVSRIHEWPLSAIVGPSGVGKSSFVRAGVVPALRSFGVEWQVLVTRPGRQPLLALANQLAPLVGAAGTSRDAQAQHQNLGIRLAHEPGYLGTALRAAHRETGQKFVIFVDQFEELYTLCPDPVQRRIFAQCLAGAADDATAPVRVIVSLRSDFLGRVGEDAHFMSEISKGLFFLGTPGPEGLREALVSPAEMVDYRFESEDMVREMLTSLEKTPGALPLLQFTAAELWEHKDDKRKLLTVESYRAMGGIAGALASHADRVVEKLTPEGRALCRTVCLQLVTAERTRAIREVEELRQLANGAPEFDEVLSQMVESRLLVVQTGGGSGGATVEIVHESLIEAWLTLRRWLEESHEDSMFLEQLRAAARQWEAKRRDSGLLWGGEMAEELERFQRRHKRELPEVVRDFVRATEAARVRRAGRKRRLMIAAAVTLTGLLAAASVALVVVSDARTTAERNAEEATAARRDAQRRLEEVQEKERQRLLAQEQTREATQRAVAADKTVELTSEELARKNVELTQALEVAKSERVVAMNAQRDAEHQEAQARASEDKAQKSAAELEVLLRKERARSERLGKQLGSSVVEVLK
jgi:serine/threonine protein kinase